MEIIVCVKQVPSSNKVNMDPITKTIIRDAKQSVINPYDSYALEEALSIKDKTGGNVTVISMGIPSTENIIRDSIARGADRGILLSDRKFAGADTLATSYTLGSGIKSMGKYDIIICGKLSVDGDTGQIGPELAEQLGIPHITDVEEFIQVDPDRVICRKVDEYTYKVIEVKLPALFTINKDVNVPRLPSITGIIESLEGDVKLIDSSSIKVDENRIGLNGSPTSVVKTFIPENEKKSQIVEGSLRDKVLRLIEIVSEVI